jgi:hypothetical protein
VANARMSKFDGFMVQFGLISQFSCGQTESMSII